VLNDPQSNKADAGSAPIIPNETGTVAHPALNEVSRAKESGWSAQYCLTLQIVDTVAIAIAMAITVFAFLPSPPYLSGLNAVIYWSFTPMLALVWIIALGFTGSRDRRIIGSGLDEYRLVISASIIFFAGLAISSYWFFIPLARTLFVVTLPLGVFLLLLGRWAMRGFLTRRRLLGRAKTPALVIGLPEEVELLLKRLSSDVEASYKPVGVCFVGNSGTTETGGLPVVDPDAIKEAVATGQYGAVIITGGMSHTEVRDLAWNLENYPVDLMFAPSMVDFAGPRIMVSSVAGLSVVHVDLPKFSDWRTFVKRAFDIVFSALALIVLAPVFLVVAIVIKLDDKGPVFFRQERIGIKGKPFVIHKFRSMKVDAEQQVQKLIAEQGGTALLFKVKNDPRITRVGAILRKYSIDELPQFWTVLLGGMSIVGPRPQVAREVAEYADMHYRRLLVKPGITGLWQISGRNDLTVDESIALDLRYVENWSFVGDLLIMLKTVRVVLKREGAY
jgi:exopolysaccharide biosynthesis polyprenyl glycosylphosphotransferase